MDSEAVVKITRPARAGSEPVSSFENLLHLLPSDNTPGGLAGVQAYAHPVRATDLGCSSSSQPQQVLCLDLCGAAATRQEGHRSEVVLVIDTSYSMNDVMEQVRSTCTRVFMELGDEDSIAMVRFDSTTRVLLPLTQKCDVMEFDAVCKEIYPGGATDLAGGLQKGFETFLHRSPNQSRLQRFLASCTTFAGEPPAEVSEQCNSVIILLSDGKANVGIMQAEQICGIASTCMHSLLQKKQAITLHTLGFTPLHDISLMSRLPQLSTGSLGSYYYVGSESDIGASVGDCLGAMAAIRVCNNLAFNCKALASGDAVSSEMECCWFGPELHGVGGEDGLLAARSLDTWKPASLKAGEHLIALLVAPADAHELHVQISWETVDGVLRDVALVVELEKPPAMNLLEVEEEIVDFSVDMLVVKSHLLRLKVAEALAVLAVNSTVADRYEDLHAAVLNTLVNLHGVKTCEGEGILGASAEETLVFLEGMLQSLERDLGEGLASGGSYSNERMGVLLSFASEHFQMRSASSLTRVRTAYASKEQIKTRLRFLLSGANSSAAAKESTVCNEAGLSEEELACRKVVDEQECFATLATWRECVLGLGLFVHPRTCRERRANIPAQVDLVVDYVSAEAYNFGVRAMITPVAEEREDGAPQSVMGSSARQRINGWLPLFINEAHWQGAKLFAPSAFSLITTQLNAVFVPQDALRVCARLMCCAVVGFVRTNTEQPGASEKAVQMYCDVHRLFLQMAEDYPEIRHKAEKQLKAFIQDPEARTRRVTSDLGLLITFLSIVDSVSWEDLYHVFVPEMVRRAFARMSESFQPELCCQTTEDVLSRFEELEPEHGRVILFFTTFNSLVARPTLPWDAEVHTREALAAGGTHMPPTPMEVEEVVHLYDRRWGRLSDTRRDALIAEVHRLRRMSSVKEVLQELVPHAFSTADICELLLWASSNGFRQRAIPKEEWPQLDAMGTSFAQHLERRVQLRQALAAKASDLARSSAKDAAGKLDELLVYAEEHVEAAKQAEKAEKAPDRGHRFASRKEACAAAARAREAAKRRDTSDKIYVDEKGELVRPSAVAMAEAKSALQRAREKAATQVHSREKVFSIDVRICADLSPSGEDYVIRLEDICYCDKNGDAATGSTLRDLIAKETGLDAGILRLMLLNVPRTKSYVNAVTVSKEVRSPNTTPLWYRRVLQYCPCNREEQDTWIDFVSNSARLGDWDFTALSGLQMVVVERKQRGGKRKPGNGWHRLHENGRTYVMNIAAAIVRDRTFARVKQYYSIAPQDASTSMDCLEVVHRLCSTLSSNAIVLCGGGLRAVKHHLLQQTDGWVTINNSDGLIRLGCPSGFAITLVEESDAEGYAQQGAATELEEMQANFVRSRSHGAKVKEQVVLPTPAEVVCPPEDIQKSSFAVVLHGGALREVASLGGIVNAMAMIHRDVKVFHLATDSREALIESEEQREALLESLPEGCTQLRTAVELEGQAHIPKNAVPIAANRLHIQGATLPIPLKYQLRAVQLGLVMRLVNRFGVPVTEVPWDSFMLLLTSMHEQ